MEQWRQMDEEERKTFFNKMKVQRPDRLCLFGMWPTPYCDMPAAAKAYAESQHAQLRERGLLPKVTLRERA